MALDKLSLENIKKAFKQDQQTARERIISQLKKEGSDKVYLGDAKMQQQARQAESDRQSAEFHKRFALEQKRLEELHFSEFGGSEKAAIEMMQREDKLQKAKEKFREQGNNPIHNKFSAKNIPGTPSHNFDKVNDKGFQKAQTTKTKEQLKQKHIEKLSKEWDNALNAKDKDQGIDI